MGYGANSRPSQCLKKVFVKKERRTLFFSYFRKDLWHTKTILIKTKRKVTFMYNELTANDDKFYLVKRIFRNKYWAGAFLIIGIVGLLLTFFPEVLAYSSPQGIKDQYESLINGSQKTSIEFMGNAYSLFGDIFRPSYVTEKTANTLIGGASAIRFVDGIQAVIVTLAGAAIAIFFTTNIIKESQKGDLSIEYWQRVILNLVISLVTTLLATRIMLAIYLIGDSVIKTFISSLGNNPLSSIDKSTYATYLAQIPGMESLPDVVSGGSVVDYDKLEGIERMLNFMELVVWVPMVIGVFLMYSAIFEIKVRELFAPLAVSSIMIEGSRGSGARFLKKFAACYLKIAIYFVLAYFGMEATRFFFQKLGDTTAEAGGINLAFICMLMSNVVAGMAMMQTGGLADEIVGA